MKKTRNQKGFTLLEMMIIVTIVGILASVCVPIYMSYIQKSRVRKLVYPGLHIIETNIALYYAATNKLPDATRLPDILIEADTTYFNVSIIGDVLAITIDSPTPGSKLSKLNDMPMFLEPATDNMKIKTWALRGTLANYLGINTGSI